MKSEQSQQAIESMIQQQLQKLTKDQLSIKQITSQIDIDLEQVLQTNGNQYIESQLNNYYTKHQNQTIASLLPNQLVTFLNQHVDNATDLLCDRARNYLSSAKGTQDINDMLDTFSMRKVS
ncbi:membrane protein [Staphylococcus aureus]|uniref:Membrane protein n=1 Tax=Staphylococcus aureus TaxID=1280 RepID=A0A380EJI1_STAAU|nr:membrane protein [Staphylococcus aureus]